MKNIINNFLALTIITLSVWLVANFASLVLPSTYQNPNQEIISFFWRLQGLLLGGGVVGFAAVIVWFFNKRSVPVRPLSWARPFVFALAAVFAWFIFSSIFDLFIFEIRNGHWSDFSWETLTNNTRLSLISSILVVGILFPVFHFVNRKVVSSKNPIN